MSTKNVMLTASLVSTKILLKDSALSRYQLYQPYSALSTYLNQA